MVPVLVAARFSLGQPVQVVRQRVTLKALDADVCKAGLPYEHVEAAACMEHQMLAPKGKLLERFGLQECYQKITRMRNLDNQLTTCDHLLPYQPERPDRVREMLQHVEQCHDLEIIVGDLLNVWIHSVTKEQQLLSRADLRLDRARLSRL